MKTKLKLTDFTFVPSGYGHFNVYFTCPDTGGYYRGYTNDMPLIDKTKNADRPKIKDLERLRYICVENGKLFKPVKL